MTGALDGKIALVTGASRGIGAAVARRFATEGAHVVLLARTVGGLEDVDDRIKEQGGGGGTTLVPVDLQDSARLDTLGPLLFEKFDALDIFVANAAMLGGLAPLGHYDADLWRRVFEVNVHANWHLIRTLDPLLRRSPAGRAIFVTADVAATPKPFWGAYAAAKAALENMARTWALEAQRSALTVNLIDPGPVATKLRTEAFPGEDPAGLPAPETVTDAFVELASAGGTAGGAAGA